MLLYRSGRLKISPHLWFIGHRGQKQPFAVTTLLSKRHIVFSTCQRVKKFLHFHPSIGEKYRSYRVKLSIGLNQLPIQWCRSLFASKMLNNLSNFSIPSEFQTMSLCCDLDFLVSCAVLHWYHVTIMAKTITIHVWWKQEPHQCWWWQYTELAWNLVEMERWDSDETKSFLLGGGLFFPSPLICINSSGFYLIEVSSGKAQRHIPKLKGSYNL